VVGVFAMQFEDRLRIHRRADARVACLAQQLLQQCDIDLLIIDDENLCAENIGLRNHHIFPPVPAPIDDAPALLKARSSASRNSAMLIGLVRYAKKPASNPRDRSRGPAFALKATTGIRAVRGSSRRIRS